MQVSAIQNQLATSTQGLQAKKMPYSIGVTKGLTADSFSSENNNKISFVGLTSRGKIAGGIAGIAAAVAAAVACAPAAIIVGAGLAIGAIAAAVNNDDDDHSNTDQYFGP